ncbi:hypothetical protein LU11_gp058 [Pseudomonas phage Lu11]|uniref:hypothetical protein n=1 Tax=Pseudomonas phage Lu11 TaxID=1161927 RepID=UPI00025F1514|nr:hypothetical protein LU11_gp058 [Pseudomonas phage Lu11]AFH14589.1 hypothetical protein Lu11_0058 [Pseudomonas phage Lu11]
MKFDSSNLPSRMIPYASKHIEVNPFRPKHMPYLSEAIYTKNHAPLIEAVGQVMDFDVMQLTHGDFFYILTWLRFNSRDLPIYADWECDGVLFKRKDTGGILNIAEIENMRKQFDEAQGTEAETLMEDPAKLILTEVDCTAHNHQFVTFEDFSVKEMDETPIDDALDYPRVRHLVEYLDLGSDKRYGKVIGPVAYIKEGKTLHERLTKLDRDEIDMELFDKASRAHFLYDHGIMQRVYKECPTCTSLYPFDAVIDAHSFFV